MIERDEDFEPEHEHLLDDGSLPDDELFDYEDDEDGADPMLDDDEEL